MVANANIINQRFKVSRQRVNSEKIFPPNLFNMQKSNRDICQGLLNKKNNNYYYEKKIKEIGEFRRVCFEFINFYFDLLFLMSPQKYMI